jgi:hypothetical protein
MEGTESLEAKFVRRTKDDRWEYGICKRISFTMKYDIQGVKDTMREAEDAIGMGQPQPGSKFHDPMLPKARCTQFGTMTCSGKY